MNLIWLMPAKGGHRMPASRKIYLAGSRPDIRVPMREIALSGGNPPLRLYDTSGPYTDPDAQVDIKLGLPPLRLPWILGRSDVEELPGPSSLYRRQRESDPSLGGVRFASVGRAGRAAPGPRVTPHPPRQREPPGTRADDHRAKLPGEDQRQHWQLGRGFLHRGGGREDALGHPLGCRHRHGPLHREEHPRDARVDPPELAGPDRGPAGTRAPRAPRARRPSRGRRPPRPSSDRAGRAG